MLPRNKIMLIFTTASILLTAIPNMALGQVGATVELSCGQPMAHPRTASINVNQRVAFQCSMSCDYTGGNAWVQQTSGPANIFTNQIILSPCAGAPNKKITDPFTTPGVYLYNAFCPSCSVEQDTIIVTSTPIGAPAFTPWGFIGLMFVLLALTTWVFFRRRKVVDVRS